MAVVEPKNFVHAFGPCTSRKTRYAGALTSLHESVPLSDTLVAPFAGDWLPGAELGQTDVEVEADPESLPLFGSKVAEVTFAVFVIVAGGVDCTMYFACVVLLVPAGRVTNVQGNAVQSPVAGGWKVRPAGVGSLSVTLLASDGPLFVRTIV